MKITYDKTIDAMYIHLNTGRYARSKKVTNDILVDINRNGKILGVEILSASKNIASFNPQNTSVKWQTLSIRSSAASPYSRTQ